MDLTLFESESRPLSGVEYLALGSVVLRQFATSNEAEILNAIKVVENVAPFRHMITPGGFRMSAAMTNCGSFGWVSERSGYRYDAMNRETGKPWPPMPDVFLKLAHDAAAEAGFADFIPDGCLINCYEPGAKLSLHQDKDEQDKTQPIVSVSLGLPAVFLFGCERRDERPQRIPLTHGDVVVWGGLSRLSYHGVMPLKDGSHPLTGAYRMNLTFRRAR
ncbi:MAG: DNA oxidative demethylase AlkB [Pyrinomonadaceae bacterium]